MMRALHAAALLALAVVGAADAARVVYRNGELALQDPAEVGEVVLSPRPHETLRAADLPDAWDWRNVDGKSLTTGIHNQHIPTYCGSCWNFAAMSSIADRLKIQTKGVYPAVMPSNQVLINCGNAGSCNGGDSNAANKWVHDQGGIPDVTCQAYQAKNMDCTPMSTCMNCDHTFGPFKGRKCYAIEEYPKIMVEEYGSVTGDDEIMAEIYARGPVACYIDAGPLEDYDGGINMYEGAGPTNHAIALIGYGEEDGTKYWIGRNSWGSYWGELGWFRIVRGGAFNPGTCYWAVPSYDYSVLGYGPAGRANTNTTATPAAAAAAETREA